MKVLISGTNSGLGKWLSKKFPNCDKLVRESSIKDFRSESYDLIIHCAGCVKHYTWSNFELDMFEDNVFLTRDLVSIPHKKFVYISSIDAAKDSPYGSTKRLSEIIVKELCEKYLILRPSALLGKEMKKNTFQKILRGEDIVLSKDSVMNYILYEDILQSIDDEHIGLKVLRSNDDVTVEEVVNIFGKKLNFGNIHYEVEYVKSDINTNKTSKDNLKIYKQKYVD